MPVNSNNSRNILYFQVFYYLITALWPLLNIDSFMSVTGPKSDIWLVRTLALIILCVAVTLFVFLFMKERSISMIFLSLMIPIVFVIVDVYYSLNGIISKIYLVDAIINFAILIAWLFLLRFFIKGEADKGHSDPV